MTTKFLASICAGLLFCALATLDARAQSDLPKFEVGAHFTTLDLRETIGEKPAGIGARFTYNVDEHFSFDSEINYFPEDGSNNFGETQGLFGLKAGKRFSDKIGVFAKARPGFVRLGDAFVARNPAAEQTKFALDVGGVVEFYPSERFAIRIDVGDTIIPFGNDVVDRAALPDQRFIRPGTTHNLQAGIGFQIRF